jgi:hypothetical protein
MTHPHSCNICGKPLQASCLTNVFGDQFCYTHDLALEHCFSCGRPICEALTRGGLQYADGRDLCNLCLETAVQDEDDAVAVLRQVRAGLATVGLDVHHPEIQPKLANRDVLLALAARNDLVLATLDGITETRKYADGRREIGYIYVLDGLPREHAALLMAHEIGHAWLFLHEFPKLPLHVEEGICEVWAATWLKLQGTPFAQHRLNVLLNNADPIYGDGYRAALAHLKHRSLPGLLEAVRRVADFP